MQLYDFYAVNRQPNWIKKLQVDFNRNVLMYLSSLTKKKKISILEIGPGKGYFYQAVKQFRSFSYTAVDQNKTMLRNLGAKNVYTAEAPALPSFKKRFTIVYAAFVIEHLKNGVELYAFIKNCSKYLEPGGLLVFMAPDTLKQKMEFWNIDYTHIFPTTKRNILMPLVENGFKSVEFIDIHGLLTHRYFTNRAVYFLLRCLFFFYHYTFFSVLFYPILKKRVHELDNPFYQLYCFAKEENLLVIAKKS